MLEYLFGLSNALIFNNFKSKSQKSLFPVQFYLLFEQLGGGGQFPLLSPSSYWCCSTAFSVNCMHCTFCKLKTDKVLRPINGNLDYKSENGLNFIEIFLLRHFYNFHQLIITEAILPRKKHQEKIFVNFYISWMLCEGVILNERTWS